MDLKGTIQSPLSKLCSIYQFNCTIEDYVEEFLCYSHLVPGDEVMLKDYFWSGLDQDISSNLPEEDASWTLAQYIDFVLEFCGSKFTVGNVEENVTTTALFLGFPLCILYCPVCWFSTLPLRLILNKAAFGSSSPCLGAVHNSHILGAFPFSHHSL